MIVRPESSRDVDAIARINIVAFADHPFSRQTEHLIVAALRAADALEVSLVAELEGAVVGHIAFSRGRIGDSPPGWFVLGPVAVLPEYQGRGLGRALIEAGLDVLRVQGADGCVLVGDPALYARFGFEHDPGVTYPGVPDEYVVCLHLAGPMPAGPVSHHPAFEVGHEIRRLGPADADVLRAARGRALETSPLAFESGPGDDRVEDPAFTLAMLSDARQAVFGAFVGGELVGFVGIVPSSRTKTSHRGDLWGLYVEPAYRRSGMGRSLMEHAVAFARSLEDVTEVDLEVTDSAPDSAALYRSLGFEEWGYRPDSIRVDGLAVGERHMWLRL